MDVMWHNMREKIIIIKQHNLIDKLNCLIADVVSVTWNGTLICKRLIVKIILLLKKNSSCLSHSYIDGSLCGYGGISLFHYIYILQQRGLGYSFIFME